MSGPKTAGYQISAAEQARLREQERLRALRRQWQAVQEQHRGLQLRAARLRDNYGFTPPVLPPLPEAGAQPVELETALTGASEVLRRGEAELSQQERLARDAITRALVAEVVLPAAPPSIPTQDRRSAVRRAAPATVSEGTVSEADALEKDLARAVEIMAKLDPEIEPPERLTGLVTALAQAETGRRRILLAQLGADVSAVNADARSRRTQAAAIAEAERVEQQTNDPELRTLVAQVRAAHRARGVVDLAALHCALDTALRRDAAARERRFVEQVVIDVFRGLDYEILTGFEVRTPEAGALVRRDCADDHGAGHAVRVVVRDGCVDVQAVRTRHEPLPSRAQDLRAEHELCEVAPRLWQALRANGVEVNGVTSVPIGREVPPIVTVTEQNGTATTGIGTTGIGTTRRQPTHQPRAKERRL